jgi:hypothetical protein
VEAWNEWNKQNPSSKPDLTGANLFRADLPEPRHLVQKQIEQAGEDKQPKLPNHLIRRLRSLAIPSEEEVSEVHIQTAGL